MTPRTAAFTGPATILAIVAGLATPSSAQHVPSATCGLPAASAVAVGPGGVIAGDVAATESGGRVRIGRGARVGDGAVVLGDVLQLGPASSVDDVLANTIRQSRNVTIRGSASELSIPVEGASCTASTSSCAGDSIAVGRRRSRSLDPGVYRDVSVGVGGTLILGAGLYEFCSLTVGRKGAVETAGGATMLSIARELRAAPGTAIGHDAGGVSIIDVGGNVRVGSKSRVAAQLSAPAGGVDVGPGAHLVGRICAIDIHLSRRGELACPSGQPTTTTTTSSSTTTVPTTSTSSTTTTSTAPTTTVTSSTVTTSLPTTSTTVSTTTTTMVTTTSSTTSTSTSTLSTSSTTVPTTTSTTTSTSSSTTTSIPLLCGNGQLDAGETCDDGNLSDNDACPSDCVVDACVPDAGAALVNTTLSFTSPGVPVAGLEILVDYPEGVGDYAGAVPLVSGMFPPQDYGHALFVVRASATGIDSTGILTMRFRPCVGAPALTSGAFGCQVQLAVDGATNPVEGVTCNVTVQ